MKGKQNIFLAHSKGLWQLVEEQNSNQERKSWQSFLLRHQMR